MKVKVRNNSRAPYGIEKAGGGYVFVPPGEERTVDAANQRDLERVAFLDVESMPDFAPPPASLKAKAEKVGKAGVFSGFLDRSIPAIIADLPGQTSQGLRQLRRDEVRGKSRKGLLPAIDAEIEARSA